MSDLHFLQWANTARPAALMFFAALMSRSCSVSHFWHSHDLTSNGSDSTICPQQLQRLELGYHWSILTNSRPAHSALYSNCLTNSPQLASAICLANWWLRIIFDCFWGRLSCERCWVCDHVMQRAFGGWVTFR